MALKSAAAVEETLTIPMCSLPFEASDLSLTLLQLEIRIGRAAPPSAAAMKAPLMQAVGISAMKHLSFCLQISHLQAPCISPI